MSSLGKTTSDTRDFGRQVREKRTMAIVSTEDDSQRAAFIDGWRDRRQQRDQAKAIEAMTEELRKADAAQLFGMLGAIR